MPTKPSTPFHRFFSNRVLITAILAGALIGLSACGESDKTDAQDPPVSVQDDAVEQSENEAAPLTTDLTPSSGADEDTVFIAAIADHPPLGLPPTPAPANNPTTPEKVVLGEALFNDARFSSTGEVSCATCHDAAKAFTDGPLAVSKGINGLTGTRNAPTVINAAFLTSQFWDGRRATLEEQSLDPFLNPVEMALPDHLPILDIVQNDAPYNAMFESAFGISGPAITANHVAMAIAAFERTVISGDSPFDRFYFGGEQDALSDAAKAGFEVFLNQGRCVSCHTISQTHAIFTDNKFHNLGIGFNRIEDNAEEVVGHFIEIARTDLEADEAVLQHADISEIGRFAVSREWQDIGQFKTPTLRNIAATAPYMHDGSLKTLREVVEFYNTTIPPGQDQEGEPNAFLSGGLRPLDLSDQQVDDLLSFLEALTSPQFREAARNADARG